MSAAQGRLTAWIPTPRTFAKGRSGNGEFFLWNATRCSQLTFNPLVRNFQTGREGNRRLPPKYATKPHIVAIAATDPLRLTQIMTKGQLLPCDFRNHSDEFVDGDQFFRAEIQGFAIVGGHQ